MSFGGRAANSSGCAIRPGERETGSSGYVGRTRNSLLTGLYVMATAEHREPCESRGSCTVLGAPGGEITPGDSPNRAVRASFKGVGSSPPPRPTHSRPAVTRHVRPRTNIQPGPILPGVDRFRGRFWTLRGAGLGHLSSQQRKTRFRKEAHQNPACIPGRGIPAQRLQNRASQTRPEQYLAFRPFQVSDKRLGVRLSCHRSPALRRAS